MKFHSLLVLGGAFSALLVGCGAQNEVRSEPEPKAPIRFDGEVQARLVGEWKTIDGRSNLALMKDGKARITIGSPNPRGKSFEDEGLWLAGKGTLLLSVHKARVPLRYFVTPKGADAIELRGRQGSTIATMYQRKR